ncbi:MAG: type II toxin-antitoxin system HicA family toxin [Firmicutes bacterium]|nr:type II toxin-antitoxin system HicA family toxin [Bacillota bacterium]
MSQWDKLLAKISALSKDLKFEELKKVLESYGYVMTAPKGGSSHYTFRKDGCSPLTIPKHNPIKKVYVAMVKQVVESEEQNDADIR